MDTSTPLPNWYIRNKPKSAPKEYDPAAFENWIHESLNASPIDLEIFDRQFVNSVVENAIHAVTNSRFHHSVNDIDLKAYSLPASSKPDWSCPGADGRDSIDYTIIIVDYETGYIYSNKNNVLYRSFVERGVSFSDYHDDSPLMMDYVWKLTALQNPSEFQ